MINLENPEHAYFFGFAQTDGTLSQRTRNRGRLSIEISEKDKDILYKFQSLFPDISSIRTRTRTTNFSNSKDYTTFTFNIFNLGFRTELNNLGIPYGKKSDIIAPPVVPYSKIDYIRGLIDGDGSLGLKSDGLPFIGFVTSSENIKNYFIEFIYKITGKTKILNRNKRDNVYNLSILNEDAQNISKILYYDNCLCLERKIQKAKEIICWKRPSNIKKIDFEKKHWHKNEDDYILTHSLDESIKSLNRTKKSIYIRLWRLKANP